jgi:AAA+ ATPase superfamily predicted ATPase
MKRNKINDYSFVDQFHYIDPNNYISKLDATIDHVIFGRRGSGKTTLLQKSIKRHSDKNNCVLIDCEILKSESELSIIISFIEKISESIKSQIDREHLKKLSTKKFMNTNCLSRKFVDKEKRDDITNAYNNYRFLAEISNILTLHMMSISKVDDVVEFDFE